MLDEQIEVTAQEALVNKANRWASCCLTAAILCLLFGFGQVVTDSILIATNSNNETLMYLSLLGMPIASGILGILGAAFFALSDCTEYRKRRMVGLILSLLGIILDILLFVMIIVMILIGG